MSSCGWFPLRHAEIVAWVQRHRAELPRDLAGLACLPMRFRAVIVHEVGLEQRVRFWTEHLQTFLVPTSELTEAQRVFLRATLIELPDLLKAPAPNAVMGDWESRAAHVFSRMEAARLFGMLGPPEPPEGIALPPMQSPTGRSNVSLQLTSARAAEALRFPPIEMLVHSLWWAAY